jgi:hypothetical protein
MQDLLNFKKEVIKAKSKVFMDFINNNANLLFTMEYQKEDGTFVGVLVAWEKYVSLGQTLLLDKKIDISTEATHYELFKRNVFSKFGEYDRIIFVDKESLKKETKYFISYVEKVLNKKINKDEIFIILDKSVKQDRIYDYKVKGAFVPKHYIEVYYDVILKGRNKLTNKLIDPTLSLDNLAKALFGAHRYAWILALVNPDIIYFNTELVVSGVKKNTIQIPNKIEDVMTIIKESISMFGLKNTFRTIGFMLGTGDEEILCEEYQIFLDSINEKDNIFSKTTFDKKCADRKIPVQIDIYGNKNVLNLQDLSEVMQVLFNFVILCTYSGTPMLKSYLRERCIPPYPPSLKE